MKSVFNLNPIDLQTVILGLLTTFNTQEIERLHREARSSAEDLSEEQKEYLYLCIAHVLTRSDHPEYCCEIEATCRTIAARQISTDENVRVYKKDFVKKFGWNNNVRFDRIKYGESVMPAEKIQTLCSAFDRSADRRFWTNQLCTFFPDTFVSPGTAAFEHGVLIWIVSHMDKPLFETSLEKMSEQDREILSFVSQGAAVKESKLGEPPYSLYSVIEHLRARGGISVYSLAEDELQITHETWFRWRRNWIAAEQYEFAYVPSRRLRRRHLLVMALLFELNYLETLIFLTIAGYRLGNSEDDLALIRFLLNDSSDSSSGEKVTREELKAAILCRKF